jgi:Protein of unknown function (DUF1638)
VSVSSSKPLYLKVIACEVAVREICFTTAQSPNVIDLEFLTQGHHDRPGTGREEIQKRIDAVPQGKYDAIVLGYGLCSSILDGLTTHHTMLVVPRAHDCITLFLGAKERYQELFDRYPGTYYYTSGWLECARRRHSDPTSMFVEGTSQFATNPTYERWVQKYGPEKARYLLETMGDWMRHYSRGTLIDFDFTKPLKLAEKVQSICKEKGWQFNETAGDISLFQRLMDGDWREGEVLLLKPGYRVVPVHDNRIIAAEKI